MLLTDSTTIVNRDNVQVLQIHNALAQAQICLFGGHILSFKPKHDGRERLWCSEKAIFDGQKAIRGGIPICWPWFGDHKRSGLPAHGYVRTQTWTVVHCSEDKSGTKLTLQPKQSSGQGFDGEAQLQLVVVVGKTLSIALQTKNVGTESFNYCGALHSYFAVSDIRQCAIQGLSGNYSDKTNGYKLFATPTPYHVNAETDRVHLVQPKAVSIVDANDTTQVISQGHDSIVVWNPWQEKSINMQDMANDSYQTMLCVETAITQGQAVAPGQTHILEQIVA